MRMRVADTPMGNSKKAKPRLEGGGVLSRDGMIALHFLCGRVSGATPPAIRMFIAEVLDEHMQVVSKPFKMDALATKIRESIEA